jgi:hypothetical protein
MGSRAFPAEVTRSGGVRFLGLRQPVRRPSTSSAHGTKRQFGDAPHQTAIETKLLFVVLIDLMTVTHIAAVAGFERRASVCLTIR